MRVTLNNGKISEEASPRRGVCIPDIPAMKKRRILPALVALVTLGSGVLNLLSVIGPSQPYRRALLHQLFPLEFLRVSRFLTLLIGFALVISSLNIYKRKKRAFQVVLLLAGASALFHLTKGLDYEEALFSLALVSSSGMVETPRLIFPGELVKCMIAAGAEPEMEIPVRPARPGSYPRSPSWGSGCPCLKMASV